MTNRFLLIFPGLILLIGGIWALLAPFAASIVVPGIVLAVELISTGIALVLLRPRRDREEMEPVGTTRAIKQPS